MDKQERVQQRVRALLAARDFQELLIRNGAKAENPKRTLFGYEPKNLFRSIDGSQLSFH